MAHPSNGNMLANMASLLYRQGRPNDALDFARRAFEVQEKAAGAPTQNSAAIRSIYASALIAKGDYADAITFLDAALPILVEQLGAESDRTLLARTYRATALSQLGRYDEALAEQRAVALISDSKLPEFHRDRAGSYIGLASIALRADRLDIAREAVAQAVALQSQALVAEHPDVLATKAMALAIDSRLQLRSAAELTREAKALLLVMQRNLSLSQNGTIGQRERATFAYLAEVLLRAGEDLETSSADWIRFRSPTHRPRIWIRRMPILCVNMLTCGPSAALCSMRRAAVSAMRKPNFPWPMTSRRSPKSIAKWQAPNSRSRQPV